MTNPSETKLVETLVSETGTLEFMHEYLARIGGMDGIQQLAKAHPAGLVRGLCNLLLEKERELAFTETCYQGELQRANHLDELRLKLESALASLADELRLARERVAELENALRDVFGLAQGLAEDDSWYAEQREAEETFERVRKALKEPR